MTPNEFVTKWKAVELKERSAAQSHFIDLCRMLDEPAPTDAGPTGDWYCFERGATKSTGDEGRADVWKRGHFGWEYKGKKKNLDIAFAQLQQYALALENPPLLVVWLKPADLVRSEPEVAQGFPDRVMPVDDSAGGVLKTRTLTSLYRDRPTWLVNAHNDLDAAVAAAYGWSADISEDDALAALLELNAART
jgi:hypothetical protein